MISHPFVILFFLLIIICSLPIVSSLDMLQKVKAQFNTTNTTASTSSTEGAKVLVDDTIQALKNKDVNKAVVHLNLINQQLSALGNTSSVQSVKVLLDDVTLALKNRDTNKALVHLNLAKQQLAPTNSSSNNIARSTTPSTSVKGTTLSTATSQINKAQANHPPVAYNQTFITKNKDTIHLKLKGNDIDGDPINFSIKSDASNGNIGGFNSTTGELAYDPIWEGNDSFTFQVTDNHNATSNIAQVSITVNAAPSESTTTRSEQSTPSPSQPSQPENNGNTGSQTAPCVGQFCNNNNENTQSNNDINWESLCDSYGSLVGLKEPCSYYAHGTQLTPAGGQALICLLGGGLLAVINPSVAAAAKELASRSNTICP
jgi:hypothetical protein